jgi:hypothetical protein
MIGDPNLAGDALHAMSRQHVLGRMKTIAKVEYWIRATASYIVSQFTWLCIIAWYAGGFFPGIDGIVQFGMIACLIALTAVLYPKHKTIWASTPQH